MKFCLLAWCSLLFGCSDPAPLSEREAALQKLAEYVMKELHPKKVVVVSNPFSLQSGRSAEIYDFEKASLAGLGKGFGDRVEIANVFPELRTEAVQNASSVYVDPQTTTPLSFLITERAFEMALEKHGDCDVVVSLIGLPLDLPSLPAWIRPGSPRFALLLPDWRMIGGRQAIVEAYKSGKLVAAIVRGPKAASPSAPFILVTRANVEQLTTAEPQLFGI